MIKYFNFMVDEYNIKDLYMLKMHSEQQGLSVRQYLSNGRRLGFTEEQIIQTARDSVTLQEAVSNVKKNERRKTGFRIVGGLAGLVVVYALNIGINLAIARSTLPKNFDMRQRTIAEQQEEIRIYREDIKDLPNTELRKFKLANMEAELEGNVLKQESSSSKYR